MSKFHLYCSCISCKEPLTTQNIKSHYKKYHSVKDPKSYCLECQEPIYSNNKFCNQSCSAKYNNKKRIADGWKPTVKQVEAAKISIAKLNYKQYGPAFTKIKQCKICNKFHPKNSNTCSDACNRKYLSIRIKNSIANNTFNPKSNRGRNKRSYMELSFEKWLNENYPSINYITEQPFRRYDIVKTYFGDFYFPDLALIIELDGTQHLKTIDYDIDRDAYIMSHYNVEILRISHNEYQNKSKLDLVKELLSK